MLRPVTWFYRMSGCGFKCGLWILVPDGAKAAEIQHKMRYSFCSPISCVAPSHLTVFIPAWAPNEHICISVERKLSGGSASGCHGAVPVWINSFGVSVLLPHCDWGDWMSHLLPLPWNHASLLIYAKIKLPKLTIQSLSNRLLIIIRCGVSVHAWRQN